ncbi:MAG: MFS transporter [Patescibacteria group bacterium]|nr:MFS transporter [Patescibacteria group bacterium]
MNITPKESYLSHKISKGFKALYKSRGIIYIATGLLGLYIPIFLFNIFDGSLQTVAWFYLIGNLIYFLTVAYGAKNLNRFGFRRSLQTAAFFGAVYFTLFYFVNESNYKAIIPAIIIILVIYRLLYWIPYHVDFAKFSSKKNRGKEISLVGATSNFIAIFTPILAGFIITQFSFQVLFIIAVLLYILSVIPLFKLPRTREKFTWSIKQTWGNFFSKKRRPEVLAFMADGAESSIGTIVWPIFMFQILNGDYLKLGFISTLIVAVTIILQLIVGKYTDKKVNRHKLLRFGSTFYAIGWIIKIFIATAFQMFVIDAYQKLMKIFMRIPFDAMTYEKAADEGHYVDEFTVIREMAVNLGRVLMLLLVILSSLFANIQITFILGAIAAMLFNFLRVKTAK